MQNLTVSTKEVPTVTFLKEIMRRRGRLPSQLASDLGISHATVSRWLSTADVPSTRSCRKLAAYSGAPLEKVLAIVGHMPIVAEAGRAEWPEFRDYARQMYPEELDEDLIEKRRQKRKQSRRREKPKKLKKEQRGRLRRQRGPRKPEKSGKRQGGKERLGRLGNLRRPKRSRRQPETLA